VLWQEFFPFLDILPGEGKYAGSSPSTVHQGIVQSAAIKDPSQRAYPVFSQQSVFALRIGVVRIMRSPSSAQDI
jgi:hypothetical protein